MKNFFLIVLATVVFASCTESASPDLLTPATTPTDTPDTRAISDVFKVEDIVPNYMGGWTVVKTDFQGNFYAHLGWDIGTFCYDLATNTHEWIGGYNQISPYYYIFCNYAKDFCVDVNGNWYFLANIKYYSIYEWGGYYDNDEYSSVVMVTHDLNDVVELTSFFPQMKGRGICVDEIGNLFVIAGEEGEKSKIYRLDAETGEVEEVVSNIEPLCDIAYYFNSKNIMKMSGAYVGGLCADGRLYKANTDTGEVEYITPRFPVGKLVTAASNKSNFYALRNGNQIVEIRPNMAADLIVGMISSTMPGLLDFEDNYMFSANPDATIFYSGFYKLTLKK